MVTRVSHWLLTENMAYRKEAITRALQVTVKEMGYSEMRSKQEEVVGHFLSGRDVFVSLPTGSGKSFLRRSRLRKQLLHMGASA